MTPRRRLPHAMGEGQTARGTDSARVTEVQRRSPLGGSGAGGLHFRSALRWELGGPGDHMKKGRPQPHVAAGPGVREELLIDERNVTR